MILTTTETICGKELETLGLVKGSTIQTVNAVRDIGAGLKTLVGGPGPGDKAHGRGSRGDGRGRDRGCPLQLGFRYAECGRSDGIRHGSEISELKRWNTLWQRDSLTENRPLSNRKGKPAGRIAACRCFLLPVLYSYMRWPVKWIKAESMCTQF